MFKKKFRSLAIVALSFLMVVSFGVGISTFDTKYTPKAQAATTTIVDFNSDVATTLNLTVNTKSSKLNTSSHKINDNAYIISTNTSSGSNYPYVGSSTYAGSMFSGTSGDVNYHGITIRTGAFLIKTPSAGTVTFNFYANGSSSSAYYFGKHSDQATTPSLTSSNFTALYSGTSAIASTTTGAVSAGSKFSTTGRYSYDYPVSEGAWFKFYSNSSAYLLVESITFTPSTPAATYDVTFNKNAGNDTVSNMPDDASISKIPETEPTRSGYVFKGWSTTESGSATYQAGDAVESALTLFAVWAKAYTVTFNTNGGGSIDSQTIESGNTASAPNEPKKSGYDFGGWFTDEDCTNAFNFSTAITQDYTLYAKWTEEVPDSFTVKFMNNGNVYHTANVTEGNTVDRPDDPTNNSALWFGGWWTKDGTQSSNWGAGGSNRSGLSGWGYVFDFDKELTQDTTVYAMWVNTMDATGFQTYIDGLVRSGLIDPYCKNREKPLWNTEGFKTKWHYIDGVFLNSIVNLYYNASESENITYTSWSGNGGTGEEVTTNKKQFYYDFFTNYVSDYVNDNGGFNTVTQGTGATKSTSLGNTLDNICESKILYDAYVLTGEEKYLKALETTKGILNNMTKVNGSEITIDGVEYYNYSHQNGNDCVNEIWLDGMYMYAPFLARYLKATNASSSEYQELLAQYSFMLKKMRDSDTGLYYHAYAGEGNSDSNWEKGGDKCSPNFWSRGMGWFVTSLIDVIELMPSDVPVAQGIIDRIPSNFSSAYGNTIDTSNGKAFLQSMLKDAIDALLAHQDPNSKMIYEVIDGGITVDGLQNYLESSGSSMVAYAIMKASRLFLNGQNSKDGRSYAVRGREMFEGITAHSLYDNKLHDICKMCDITDNGATVSYYLTNSDTQIVKDESKGSAPYMMAFIEYNALINEKTPTPTKTPDVSKRRLHVNVGSEVYYVEVTKGGTTTLQAVQTALASAGYIGTINSLYTDSNLSSAYGYSAVNEDITLYATYSSGEVQTYTVTFVVDGETVKTQDVNENGYATAPSQPEKSGYVFRGWSADGSAISDVATYAITKDTTFTALWEEESSTKYTVTFDLNGGNIGGETSYSIQVSDGAYATKPTNPTKTGSTFMGWYTSEDKSAKKDEFDFDEETITGALTLHALWFDSVDENAIVSYIQGLMEDTDLTTMDQGAWNTETWRGYFNYVNGIFLNSLVNLSYNTNDANQKAEYQQFVVDYLERYIRQDGTIVQYPSKTAAPDPENASEFTNIVRIDFIQTVRTLFDAYEFSGDERFLKAVEYALDKFASAAKVENTYNNPPHTPSDLNEIWLDGLYMYAPLYARYIAAGGTNSNYSALELFNQYTVVVDNMRDTDTGLYYHGYAVDKDTSASPWADPETGLSASFWSRSIGWLAMSLVDVLDYYPTGVTINKSFNGTNYTDARAYLTAVFKDLMDSLLSFQDPDSKMFYQIVNHDSIITGVSNDNYLETSGSAMFAYALMKGGKAGYLSGTYTTTYGDTLSYNDIGRQIFEGVYAHSVSVSGSTVNVYDICGATSLSDADSDSMSAYIGNSIVSNESKGTAPIILAFIEYFNETVNQPETPNVNERKIYLVTNGGTHNLGVDYIIANINGTLASSALPTVTKTDYEFTGWYLDSALTQAFTFDSTVLTDETTTLYAGWELSENADSIEITLNGNDGTFGEDETTTATISQNNPELLSSHIPTRDGYDFGGFADSNGTLYFDANGILCDGVEISGGETLYAVWKQAFTIKLDFSSFIDASAQTTNNNGYNTVFTLKDGTTTKITDTAGHYYYDFSANTVDGFYAPTGERLNYVLIAWVDQDGNEYAPDSLIIPTKDLTLTPIFYVDPDSIGSRVSVSGKTVTWSAYEMSNGKYPESDTNKLYQNIRWTDLYADTKVGDEFTIVSNDLVTIKVDASQLTTYGTDNGHRATTEPMIYMQPNMTSSISPVEITVNGSSVTADITIYGFFYKSGRTATLKLYNGNSEIDSVTTGEAGYGGANTITDTVLSGKTPTSGTLTGLESGNTYSLISTGTQNFYISTIVVELSTAPKFTVSFEENGGTSVSDVSNIAVGGKVSAPTAPTKSGFAFDGWYLDSSLTKAYDFNTVVTNDTTLYAKWNATGETPTYSATFNVNYPDGLSSGVSDMPNNVTDTTNTSVTPSSPTLDGYTFLGWSENASATSATYAPGASIDITGNPVLYAIWEKVIENPEYAVTIDFGKLTETSSTSNIVTDLERSGYSLTSTSNVSYDTNVEYLGLKIKNNESKLVFKVRAGYTVTVVTKQASTGTATYSKNGEEVVVNLAQNGPTSFDITDSDAEITIARDTESTFVINAITIVQTAETPDTYTVTYNANGGENVPTDSTQYSSGDTVTISSTLPTRTNYIFAGWTSSAFSGTKQAGETFTMPENNVTLTASWTATYIVTYVDGVDGEEISMPSNSNRFKEGATFTISGANPSRLGYTFAGWVSSAFDGVKQANASFTMPASDVTLTATWNPITYNIAFNKNNEDATGEMSPIVATYGQATGLTQNGFTLSGYTFLGWATSENGDVVYQDGESVENLANTQDATVTLYAIWQVEGAGNTVTVNYNFSELKDDNTGYNLNNGGNITVDGTTFTGNNHSHIYTKEATGGVLLSSSAVSRVNYNLVGWATTQYGAKVYDAGGTYSGNDAEITLYPVWEISGNTDNRTTTTVNGEIETHVWSAYVVNGAYDANNAESFYYMGTDNGAYKNIRWTDLYKNNVVDGVYTISGGGESHYSIKVDSNSGSGASVDADHRMVSEPLIKIDKETNSTTYSPISIVVNNGFTASIKVHAVVYNAASEISILASDKSTSKGSASISNRYGYAGDDDHARPNDFVGGVTPNTLIVNGLSTGTYYIANTGSNHIYITGIEVSLTPAVPEYNVNFYNNESESDDTVFETVLTFGGTLVLPNTDPIREGFRFDGWYTQREGGEKVVEGATISEDTNYYAHWTELPKYSVNFEESYPQGVNTGIKNMPSDIVNTTETSITPSSPSLAGYSFLGWSTVSGASVATYAPGASIDITGNPTLYPVWAEATEEYFIIYKNGEQLTIPNSQGIEATFVGLSSMVEERTNINFGSGDLQTGTVIKTGGSSKSTRYISFKVPSSVYSSFKVKVVGTPSSNGQINIWVSKTIGSSMGNGETAIITPSVSNTYLTGTSGSFDTADENGDDITYYLNFSSGARFYEISLELTTEINTDVERTISFVTDDNDARPFDGAIADQKVENGGSLDLTAIVPTTSSQGYVFSHWVDSLGNVYTTSIDNVLRDMTLYAKWYTVVNSADTPESTRGKVPRADAQVYGLYLPSTTTIRLANGSTVSWTVDWDYVNATYATELDGDYTAKNISNYANIDVAGFYKVTGTISVPSGYLYKIEEIETSTITVESIVEVYVIGAQVMAGAGYMSDGRTAWNSGLTLTNDRYTLSENGQVSIVVDADNIGEITSDGVINLKGETFSNSSYKNDAPIKIDLPNEYSMLLIVIKVTNATKDNVSLWTEDGEQVSLSQTVGATYTNLSISTTDNYGNILYLFSSGNNTVLHSIVVNAQYEDENINDENIEDSTNKLYYHTVVNDNNSFGEAIEEPYNYLNQAKVIVKPQTEHLDLPDHYLFSRWATATSGTASYYNPGDVLAITSETNNLYVIMEEEPKITITFDVNAPAGMTSDQISQIFGSFALEYKVYSGDKLDSMPDFSEVKFTVNGYEYTFDGWSPSITQDTTFNEDTTITANWYTATLPVIVKDLEKTVQEGTTESEIINSLPTEFVVCDINGNETSDYDYAVIVGSWTSVAYNANVAGTYIFRATLDTAPSGTVWYSSWAGVEIDSQTYDRSQDDTYYVYCKVTVVEADAYATYSAEFTAFAYTGSGDHVLYNNNSNTHDKAWSDYYQVATDETDIKGTIVARNGEVKIIADDETIVDEDDGITAALVDTDYHGQTWSMIKGYHQTSNNAPFIYVVVPKGYASVKISVYAVRFRASGNDVTLEVGPLNGTKEDMLVTDHSYTETDNETDFNYFYEFSPSYYIYEYSGDETVFTVRNTHRSTNIYLTGIKVECTMVEDESHIITYHANDGTDNALTREVVYAENESGDDAIVEKNFFEREGYEFIGWSRTKGSDSIEQNYQVGKSLELDGNITLYAVWQRARALTYYANDGSTDSFTKYYTNGRGPLSENEFDMTAETREDKVFLSWNTQSNGQGDTYYPGDIFNPNASDNRLVGVIPEGTVLYAQWGSGKTLTAKWDAYSSELQAIDTVYTDCSQTLGNDWTTKYNGKIVAKNGDVLTVNASGATAGSNAMSKPMLSLAKGNTISVNVSGITTESALSIRVSAVVASGSSKFTINGTEYSVSRTFDDGSTFTPFVADIAVYATTVNNTSTINITTTGNSAIYIVGISASVSNDQFVGNTLTYNNNIEGAEETYDYLVSGSTIVDINHFHRDGYTFAGWATTEGGEVAYTYGQELTVSEDSTLYAKWTPITYNYEFISNKATHDDGTFNLVDGITKPSQDPTLNGYIFMGWYLDDGVFQNQATFDGENKFYPSFEMIDGDTIYLYAYFIEDIHTKKIVTPNELQDLEKYIVDVMENVYREEGSTSGTAIVSASALELPANVMVTGDGFGKNLAIDWSLAVSGWTLSSLQSGTQTLTGYIKLDDSDYGSFAFSDGVNENLQQIGITVDLTLRNIIIQFNDNEPLVVKNFYYPVGTKRSAVVSQFEVKGFYFDRNGLHQEWIPTGLVWATSNYDSEEQGSYSFTTDLYADIGYAFQVKIDDVNEERKTIQATANVELQGNAEAYSGVGFERKGSSDWTNGVTGDFVIDTNGEVGNRLVLTGLSNSYGNENGYLTLDAGENALKISIPSGTKEVSISYIGGVRTVGESNTFSIVDASGNVLTTTGNLGAYQNATINKLTITSDNVDNLSSLTELYVKVNGDEILLSQILVASTPVITMSENVVKLRFVYNGVERYYAIANGDGTISTATKYVKGSKVILPDFDETGLDNRPTAENIEFAGWSNDGSSQVASYLAGGLYDLDTYSDVAVGNDTERVVTLYAVFSIGYHTLTFDSGFGKTVEFKIQIGKTVGEVITIRGVGREQALKDLELSRVGYNFVDWTYNGEIFSSNTLLGSDVVVTATWTPKTYTINYKNGNDIIITDMVTYTEMFSAPVLDKNPDYINTTRTFRTWTYNGTDWDFEQASLESEGIILDNDVYQIDLQADFGAMITFVTEYEEVVGSAFPIVRDSNVYPIGYRYSLQDRVTGLNGYTFKGWSLTQNSPTAEFTTESVIELKENITLYAVWEANDYRVTFISGNDGIDFDTLTVDGVTLDENNSALFEFNTEIPTISATATGYVIHSWYYIDEQGFERTWVFEGDNPNKVVALKQGVETFELFARWGVTVNFEKFSFIDNDDEFNQDATLYNSVVVAIDDVIPFVHTQGTASSGTLHVRPQLPGYSFVDWYQDNEGTSKFDINQAFTIEFINSLKGDDITVEAVTIYAGFNKVTGNVTISFVDAFDTGVSMPMSIQHANTSFFTVTSEYMLEGNSVAQFVGWSLYPDGSGEDIYGLGDEIFIEGDTVLYAFWSISITDIEILSPTVRNDETIQVQIPSKFNGSNGEQKFNEVFNVIWMLDSARNAEDPSDENIYNLIAGAYNVKAGSYSVPVQLRLEKGYVWAGGEDIVLSANGDYYTTNVTITVTDSAQSYFIIKIYSIEDKTPLNSDYRLDKVKAEISTISTATSGIEIMLDVTWNSQIDTTVWGTHYVLGSVLCGSYNLKTGVSNTVSATIEVTKNGAENTYLYKTYQNGKMPDAPTAPSEDFKFLCWTDKGVTAVGQNGTASAGEWTAMYTKLSFTPGASIRLNKDYTGIRFTAHLEFYGTNYVAELMKNKSNVSGAVSVTMNFTYEKDETTYNVGTGQDFMNMTQSVVGGNAIITFSGVISDLVVYDSEGNVTNKENCGIKFTPIAKVKLNGLEVDNLRAEFAMSASEVAQGVKDSAKYSSYTDEQKAIIDSYDTTTAVS